MKPKKLIVLNLRDTLGNARLRDDLGKAFSDYDSVQYVETKKCLIEATTNSVVVVNNNTEISFGDSFVFVRKRGRQAIVALLCMLFEKWGIPFTDSINASHQDSANKSFCIPRLAHHGLPVPQTFVGSLSGLKNNQQYLRDRIVYPCVIKGDGARGTRVFKVSSEAELFEKARMLENTNSDLLTIQEFIPNTYDVRALFMGDILIGAMRRTAAPGTFLNNVSQGGHPESETLSERELALCRTAIRHSGLDFCGIDFIRKDTGDIVFLEINKSPQVNGIRSVNPDLSVGAALRAFIERL